MSQSYAERFGGQRPSCFGSQARYDPYTSVCKNCAWVESCRHTIEERAAQEHRRSSAYQAPPGTYTGAPVQGYRPSTPSTAAVPMSQPVAPLPSNIPRTDPADDTGWWATLAHNGFLNAMTAAAQEGVHALQSIPRFRYPWKR